MTQSESIIVLDYGSQYSQLIVRRVREAGVYSELLRFDVDHAAAQAGGRTAAIRAPACIARSVVTT